MVGGHSRTACFHSTLPVSPSQRFHASSFQRTDHDAVSLAGGERRRACDGVSRQSRTMGPPHCGHTQIGRATSGTVVAAAGAAGGLACNSSKQRGSRVARRRWAKKPKCRIRTKPLGRTCKKKRRRNSSTRSRIRRFLFLCAESRQRNVTMPFANSISR